LTPGPERKVFAVAGFALFEFLRRLPVVLFAEQFLIRDTSATSQKFPNVGDALSLDG